MWGRIVKRLTPRSVKEMMEKLAQEAQNDAGEAERAYSEALARKVRKDALAAEIRTYIKASR